MNDYIATDAIPFYPALISQKDRKNAAAASHSDR